MNSKLQIEGVTINKNNNQSKKFILQTQNSADAIKG